MPRPAVALAQLRRVLVAGGLVGFTAWTPMGFVGAMIELMRRWVPPQSGIADLLDWGRPAVVQERLAAGGLTSVQIQRRSVPWRFDSPQAMTKFLLAHSPGHQASVRHLAASQATEMLKAVEHLASPTGAPIRIDAEYLLVTART